VTCQAEHEAVGAVCRQLAGQLGVEVRLVPVDRAGQIDPLALAPLAGQRGAVALVIMLANNETGTLHPCEEFGRLARQVGAVFFSDLTQAAGKVPINVRTCGMDLAALSAHKMYGPKGVGALFIRSGKPRIELEPLLVGGGQEWELRGGTLNVAGIVGFGAACRVAQREMKEEAQRVGKQRDRLEEVLRADLPDLWVNGDRANRLPNTSNITFLRVDGRTLIREMHDIAVSTRAACSSGKQGPSHVLKAMGLTDDEAYSSIRFSLGRFTTEAEIDYTIEKVIMSVRKLRRAAKGGGEP
jgi:cysteine desulfurase